MPKKQKNFLILIFLFFLSLFFFPKPILAIEKFVTIINPIRGEDFWNLSNQTPTDLPQLQKQTHEKYKLPSTWLLRPDFFLENNPNITFFQQEKFDSDEIGIFLEVTPSWTKKLDIKYNQTLPWYFPQNIFLSGYNPKDRTKLLDFALNNFKNKFGNYPKTVGAWHIDPVSANHLKENYNTKVFLICADQYSTDNYQIWGGWWGVPFYPSKQNLLLPAQKENDKLGGLVLWWAARDPINAYGTSVQQSIYSVQTNDYLLLNLDSNYFSKLSSLYLNPIKGQFGQLTIGLENDNSKKIHSPEYQNQIQALIKQNPKFTTSYDFFTWYNKQFPALSPPHQIGGKDILGTPKESLWTMSTKERLGLIKNNTNQEWQTVDSRSYPQSHPDPYTYTKNLNSKLYWNIPSQRNIITNTPALLTITISLVFILIILYLLKLPVFISILIFIGSLLLSIPMVRSHILYNYGLGFWGANGHDAIWHLSLINQLKNKIPPLNPIFSGTTLSNYHWGFDLLVATLSKLTNLNTSIIYFQLLPLILAFLIGLLSHKLAKKITKNNTTAFFFVFLNYFAGSFGWIITLLKDQKIGGESLFWSMQSVSALINPPYALSLVILLLILNLLFSKQNKRFFLIGLLCASLTAIKIYAGILINLTLFSLLLLNFLNKRKKRMRSFLLLFSTSAFFSFFVLLLLGVFNGKQQLIEFKPLWFVHSLIESLDKLYLPQLAILRANLSQNIVSLKLPILLLIELSLLVIFLAGNLGTRTLGLIEFLKKTKYKTSDFDQFTLIFMLFAFLIPTLFIQRGTAWNTIQFFYYFLIFSNFYFAKFLSKVYKNKNPKSFFLVFLLLIFTIPTSFSTLKDYFGSPAPASLPNYELEALNFLKKQTGDIVLTYPYDKFKKNDLQAPVPLYLYETTAYVSAFTEKSSFLEDEMNLNITGFDWQNRRQQSLDFFTTNNKFLARGFLINNDIDYIYLVNDQTFSFQENDLQITKIFDNGFTRVYKVQK